MPAFELWGCGINSRSLTAVFKAIGKENDPIAMLFYMINGPKQSIFSGWGLERISVRFFLSLLRQNVCHFRQTMNVNLKGVEFKALGNGNERILWCHSYEPHAPEDCHNIFQHSLKYKYLEKGVIIHFFTHIRVRTSGQRGHLQQNNTGHKKRDLSSSGGGGIVYVFSWTGFFHRASFWKQELGSKL